MEREDLAGLGRSCGSTRTSR
ncbi:hypothetical protein [Micromonospora echinospora]